MASLKENIKLLYILLLRNLRKIFLILPVKNNRVIFESFSGDGYNCNPKYISEGLHDKYEDQIEIIWAVKDNVLLPDSVVRCKYRSFKHFIYRITSKVYVCNFLQAVEIPKRNKQIEIQTWHGGGCYKKIGKEEKARDSAYVTRRNLHVSETDYFISSSKYFTDEVIKFQLGYNKRILPIGMPRNDCLINIDIKKRIEIRHNLKISDDTLFVLYAPTWREGFDKIEKLDYKALENAFDSKFHKKVKIAFRAHVYGKEKVGDVLDLTDYPDMQELLLTCDVLITDYSSSMWDFSLTYKPCFLYVPDLQRYLDQRGFDKDIYEWGFPVCKSNAELIDKIEMFNQDEFNRKMDKHHLDLGSYENGNATNKVIDLIANICGINNAKQN